jgi:coenzyme F420-dependent glucose-6-phosphate dehydrogenase
MSHEHRTIIGFHASHEQWPPSRLLQYMRSAERAGFSAAMCSDHFHPWSERQANSGFAWSWLGAALQATSLPFGVVTVPGQRYHPAIIAQAAATFSEMFPGRFWLAVGSGEALNEHITGERWPPKADRNARPKEAVDVIRALWRGETANHDGRVRVKEARLYTCPETPPLLFGAALTEQTAEWMGAWADGLITGGGAGKPVFLQTALAYDRDEAWALQAAHDQWRHAALETVQLADLSMPADFDAATAHVSPQVLYQGIRISSDLAQHRAWLEEDMALGCQAIYLHHVGRDVDRFIDVFGSEVLPVLTRHNNMGQIQKNAR